MADIESAVYEGISYPVSFRATPWRDADGLPAKTSSQIMWSADCEITDGISLTASGASPQDAVAKLGAVIADHTQPFTQS